MYSCTLFLNPSRSKECTIIILPPRCEPPPNSPRVLDTVKEAETLRQVRLLIFLNHTTIYILTHTYANKDGWCYTLHHLYNGPYALEFQPRRQYSGFMR